MHICCEDCNDVCLNFCDDLILCPQCMCNEAAILSQSKCEVDVEIVTVQHVLG